MIAISLNNHLPFFMKYLLRRLYRIARRYSDHEVGINLFFVKGKWRIGTIKHGGVYQVTLRESPISKGAFHNHPHGSVLPSIGDWKDYDLHPNYRLDIVATADTICYAYIPSSLSRRKKSVQNYQDYLCRFTVVNGNEILST
jgi:hypothetical protein